MYVGRDFDPSDVGESENYTLDFVRDLADGEVIIGFVGGTWTCKVAADSEVEDDDAADHASLPATYDGTKATQHVAGLVAGVKYVLRAQVETNQGNTPSLWSHVLCVEPK